MRSSGPASDRASLRQGEVKKKKSTIFDIFKWTTAKKDKKSTVIRVLDNNKKENERDISFG